MCAVLVLDVADRATESAVAGGVSSRVVLNLACGVAVELSAVVCATVGLPAVAVVMFAVGVADDGGGLSVGTVASVVGAAGGTLLRGIADDRCRARPALLQRA